MIEEVVDLTSRLIEFESVTPHDVGCQELVIEYLEQLGFSITRYPFEEASNFWAIIGSEGPLLCFAGHTDVVATGPLEQWHSPPFKPTIQDGMLFGRGSADMKGGVASMMVACKHYLREHSNFKGRIAFLITSAEEGPSETGTPIVLEALDKLGTKIDYCLIGEPTAVNQTGDMIKVGRRGSLHGKLRVFGKQGHIAYPHLADNPIHKALNSLDSFIKTEWDQGNSDFQPTSLQIANMHAGTGAGNVIPGELYVHFNFRYAPVLTGDEIMAKTEEHFRNAGLDFKIEWDHSGKPFQTKPGKLVEITQQAIRDVCGLEPELSTSGGTSDGRFIADYCDELIECGVSNKTIHQVNESASIADLEKQTELYHEILCQLLKD